MVRLLFCSFQVHISLQLLFYIGMVLCSLFLLRQRFYWCVYQFKVVFVRRTHFLLWDIKIYSVICTKTMKLIAILRSACFYIFHRKKDEIISKRRKQLALLWLKFKNMTTVKLINWHIIVPCGLKAGRLWGLSVWSLHVLPVPQFSPVGLQLPPTETCPLG